MTEHDLYTFHLVGGEPFSIQPKHNPAVHHDGGTSVFHLMLRPPEVEEFTKQAESFGCTVTVRNVEGQTEEQHKERLALLGHGKKDAVWPSIKCPECFWFDPTQDDPCGLDSWDQLVVTLSLDAHEKARDDREGCPVRD